MTAAAARTVGVHAPWHGLRAVVRLARVAAMVLLGWLAVSLVFPWCGVARRHRLVGRWARGVLAALGIRTVCSGSMRRGPQLIVANHVSWLDILALHAHRPEARFVAMAELQQWRGVRRLVDSAGTIYLQRRRLRDLRRAVQAATQALRAGDTVAVFPEGVVSDGHRLNRFHGNFLQAAIDAGVPVQAVALRYVEREAGSPDDPHAPHDIHDPAPAGAAVLFTGDVTLARSLWRLAHADGLELRMQVLAARPAPHLEPRRAMAARLQQQVGVALESTRSTRGAKGACVATRTVPSAARVWRTGPPRPRGASPSPRAREEGLAARVR